MQLRTLLLKSHVALLFGAAVGFIQTAIAVRWFGTSALGAALIVIANANMVAIFFELFASERIINASQSNPEVLRSVTRATTAVAVTLAIGSGLLTILVSAHGAFAWAVVMAFGQYGINAIYIAGGRSHRAHFLTLFISTGRLVLIGLCAALSIDSESTLTWIYIGTGASVYVIAILYEYRLQSAMPPRTSVALPQIRDYIATLPYILMIATKKLRENALGLLGAAGLLSSSGVAYISLAYRGANFVFGQMRVLEVALMHKRHYEQYRFSASRILALGLTGSSLSAIFSFIYLRVAGVSPLPVIEILLFSALALPIAANQKLRLTAFHRQSFGRSAIANGFGAFAMLFTPFVFLFGGGTAAVGYAVGCLIAEISVSFFLRPSIRES